MKKNLKPAPGRVVFMPGTKRKMKESGEEVEMTSFFYRRLSCGDCVEIAPEMNKEKNK